ncbi:MAG: helix-turn-helix domain-containing protein [Alphaproteobacteria bacterium]|nr:helix-turn-helix domain-containing protein [Alphaproteobacteria bacterium]
MTDPHTFRPDWVSPPGETIEDLLEERGWTQAEFAERIGFTRKHVNDLVKGRASITPDTGSRLATVFGGPVQFWLTREAQYQAALERRRTIEAHRADAGWLSELPLAWMAKQGWLRRPRDKGEQVEECLSFFGVASVASWRDRYAQPLAAFRASDKVDKKIGAVAAWLREAERAATALRCAPYDKAAFRDALPALRGLTVEPDPAVFVPRLQEACARVGVAVVFVPAPPGCPVHGATRWLATDKALLALSLRYKSNDQLWFSFFHEACHILKHARKQQFIEGLDGLDVELEDEANRFAGDLLIPPAAARVLATLRSAADVEALAARIGVAPGILVGRMQKEGWIPYSHLNGLKVRYTWATEEADG